VIMIVNKWMAEQWWSHRDPPWRQLQRAAPKGCHLGLGERPTLHPHCAQEPSSLGLRSKNTLNSDSYLYLLHAAGLR
jgi:hypothetical protein